MIGVTAAGRAGVRSGASARLPAWLLVGGVVMAVLSGAIAVWLPLTSDTLPQRITLVCFVIGMTGLVVTGSALLQREQRGEQQQYQSHAMGWWLVAAGLAGLVSRLVTGGLVAAEEGGAGLPAAVLWLVNWVWVPAQFAFFELLLRFPTGRLPARGWRVLEAAGVGWLAVALAVVVLMPGPLGVDPLAHVDNPFGLSGASGLLTAALGPVFLAGNALLVVACAGPVWRWVRGARGSEERQQLRWVLVAVVVTAVSVPAAVLGGALEFVSAAASLALPAAIAVAVRRDGVGSLGSVVRRALVYATTTAVLAAAYLLVVLAWGAPAAPVLAALAIAALALPVRNAAQWLLFRLLYGARGDPAAAFDTLAAGLERAAESPSATIVRVVAESLRAPRVAMEDVDGRVIAAAGGGRRRGSRTGATVAAGGPATAGAGGAELRVEITAHGEPAGWLVVTERAPGEGWDAQDRRLLARVAPQAGLIARAEQLTTQLAVSYAQLVTVREDERARLQRELHDELGPVLSGIVMRSEAARNIVRSAGGADPARVERLDAVLAAIGRDAEGVVSDVRRIIADLRPVSLGTRDLRAAVTEAVATLAPGLDARVEVPEGDLGLSAEQELAVFRVATESVRNSFRHAQARELGLRIVDEGERVVVEVRDDGVGMAGAVPGVGLRSMRERVEALGGMLLIDGGADSGTGPGVGTGLGAGTGLGTGTVGPARGTRVRAVIPRGASWE